jgi:hypothetical protein
VRGISSPYYWLSILAFGATILIGLGGKPGWMYGLVVVLYLFAQVAGEVARRHARAAGLRRTSTTDEN